MTIKILWWSLRHDLVCRKGEQEARVFWWLGLLGVVIAFILGINVGLYAL